MRAKRFSSSAAREQEKTEAQGLIKKEQLSFKVQLQMLCKVGKEWDPAIWNGTSGSRPLKIPEFPDSSKSSGPVELIYLKTAILPKVIFPSWTSPHS